MDYIEVGSWYARGLRILLRGMPLEERFKVLEQLEAGIPEEEVFQEHGRQPRTLEPVKAFLRIVEDIRKIRQEPLAEIRKDLKDIEELTRRPAER